MVLEAIAKMWKANDRQTDDRQMDGWQTDDRQQTMALADLEHTDLVQKYDMKLISTYKTNSLDHEI